jgi:hypothetical protein
MIFYSNISYVSILRVKMKRYQIYHLILGDADLFKVFFLSIDTF